VVRYTLRPWIEQIESELTSKLLSDAEQAQGLTVELDPHALLKGDTTATTNAAVQKVNAGLTTPNEERRALGYPKSTDPEADKLKRTGDTSPAGSKTPTSPSSDEPPRTNSAFAAVRPLVDNLCARVNQNTIKAFDANHDTGQQRTIWVNLFAEKQAKYLADQLGPISDALVALGDKPLDAQKFAERYATSIKRMARTGEPATLAWGE
jgi:hypothetical protein